MSTLRELVGSHTTLGDLEIDHLQAVVSDWQILADLSFADLLLFGAVSDRDEVVVLAQMRPYTAPTMYQEDLVGDVYAGGDRAHVAAAFETGRIQQEAVVKEGWFVDEAVPIWFDGRVMAVVTREVNPATVRSVSQLERAYLQSADVLTEMLAVGTFPYPGKGPDRELAPRVGDGLLRLQPDGVVSYASPNGISAYRRLGVHGSLTGRGINEFDMDDVTVLKALRDGEPIDSEVEAHGAVVLRRLLPLTRDHDVVGGLLLLREVTELRRHERLLLYKDATIQEIHHRVKNNLQTVASLLRLQGRRLQSEEARQALVESERRISSIALVHETLSQDARQRISFDKVAGRLADMLTAGLTHPDRPVQVVIEGTAGELGPDVATPLALVMSELVQNALEHAFPDHAGQVVVHLDRRPSRLVVRIVDTGVGVPVGWSLEHDANLGLQIAVTLVHSELGGTLQVGPGEDGGTTGVVDLPLL